jgi:hypothetical protein
LLAIRLFIQRKSKTATAVLLLFIITYSALGMNMYFGS